MELRKKYSVFIVFSAITISTLMFHGSTDDFIFRSSYNISQINQYGHLNQSILESVPGFFAVGSALTLITGITPIEIVFYPIQLIPITLAFYLLFYKLSRGYIFPSMLVVVVLISQQMGNHILFYMHDLGSIIFILLIYSVIKVLEPGKDTLMWVCIISLGAPLIFISYNATYKILLIVLAIVFLSYILPYIGETDFNYNIRVRANFFSGILVTTIFGLSNWTYSTLLFTLQNSEGPYTAISVFFSTYLFESVSTSRTISELAIETPELITTIGIIKYLPLALIILIFGIYFLTKLYKRSGILDRDVIAISFIGVAFIISVSRLVIGSFNYTTIFLPGLVTLAVIQDRFNDSNVIRNLVYFVVVILLVTSASLFWLNYTNDLIERDPGRYQYMESSVDWYLEYGETDLLTDIRSSFFFQAYGSQSISRFDSNYQPGRFAEQVSYLEREQVQYLIAEDSQIALDEQIVFINYQLSFVSLPQWLNMKPWGEFRERLNNNPRIDKIYTKNEMSAYKTA